MLGTITKGEYKFEPLPDNVYLAKLLSVKEKAAPKEHPDWFPSFSWTFEILTPPYAKRRAWGKSPTNWIAGKKLDNWLVTLGINVSKGTSIKIEDLKDLYVKILVKNDHYTDKETNEPKTFPKVTELLPLDSLDQIKIRELIAGTTVVAGQTNVVVPHTTPATIPVSQTTTGFIVPITTSAPVPTVPGVVNSPTPSPFGNGTVPVSTTPTGTPTRTIPF